MRRHCQPLNKKNQNVTIVTLVQNALSLIQRKCNNVMKSEMH